MTNTPSPGTSRNPIPFTPVPCNRRNGWTASKQQAFIDLLSQIGLVGAAAKAVGMSRQTAYRLRDKPGGESFAAAWDAALDMGLNNAQDHAIQRAINGYDVPYFYGGRQRGVVRRYNDRLLIAALKLGNRRAERFGKEVYDKSD